MTERRGRFLNVAALLLVATGLLGLDGLGAFRWADDMATEARMRLVPRKVSGNVVFVGIDNRSLEAIGVWPWPREIHARIARRLSELGAAEVFFDIDLSAPSNPRSDAALARALAELGGAVILPVFSQAAGIGAGAEGGEGAGALRENLPLPAFRDHTWLASVNVTPDADGRIRRYPFGQIVAGEEVPSAAAMLSGIFGPSDAGFLVNFALDPSSIPSHSAIDLLDGAIGAAEIEGRSVVVGAHAVELRDDLPVPVHGIIPGPVLHILAAETLIGGIALVPLRSLPLFLAVAAFGIAAGASPLRHRPLWVVGAFAIAGTAIEAAALALQTRDALVVPTAALHATLASLGIVVAARELDLRRWLIGFARVETRNSHNVLSRIIADSSDAVVVVDAEGLVIQMSARTRDLFALPGDLAPPVALEAVLPPALAAAAREAMASFRDALQRDALRQDGPQAGERRELAFEVAGRRRHVEYTAIPSRLQRVGRRTEALEDVVICCVTARDVTLAREQQVRLDHLARFDVLTGAMNRIELVSRLEAILSAPGGEEAAVLALNLERFKTVNASLGRDTGDGVLRALVDRLGAVEPEVCGVARLGGDTFALLLLRADRDRAEAVARATVAAVAEPFALDGVSARIGCRVGIALGRAGAAASTLLDEAELALDEARLQGCDQRVFDPASAARQRRARRIERAMWTAIENGELALAYQPQIDLGPMTWAGAEALVRWRHPVMGSISPAEFIAIAEASGFIEHLGRWVLERACRDALAWPAGTTVAVNVSPLQFQRSDVIADVGHALAVSGLDPRRLHLEITESIFVAGSTELSWVLDALRDTGISLALDDFGSGFSSFGYLARLPLDKIKLDRMFVQNLEEDASNVAIVRSVTTLARDLGLKLVCEGVETEAQRDVLRALGCDQGQGYLFGKPQTQAAITALLASPDGAARRDVA